MRKTQLPPIAKILAALAFMAACIDNVPTEPKAAPQTSPVKPHIDAPLAALSCTASVSAKEVTCKPASPANGDGRKDAVLVGGQDMFVHLGSSNVAYDSVTSLFTFDVDVQNLIPQPLGTTDGTTADSAGVKVFFVSGPTVTGGIGVAAVVPDGVGSFTGAAQPYYAYKTATLGGDGVLSPNETSSTRQWTIVIPKTASSFSFLLYVWAEVPFPLGYVDVTPVKDTIETGETLGLTATIRNYLGQAVAGTVNWSTSNGTAATVDGSGTVTGAGAGAANIIATSGARTGSARINVCPALAVGGTFTATMPLAADLCFKGYTGAEYTYIPMNQSSSASLSLTVTASGIVPVTGPPSPNLIPSNTILAPTLNMSAQDLGFEGTIASDLPYIGAESPKIKALMSDMSSRIKRGVSGDPGIRYSAVASVPSVGDSLSFNTTSSCSGTASVRRGVVRSVSQHLIVVADTANPPGGFTTPQWDSIALEFDSIGWAVDSANFGAPTDLDGNGHVIAFFTRAVNELSPPASSAVVLGFFAAKDMFSNDPASCPNSNQAEMFYMLVPDPTGAVNSNVRTVSFVRGNTTGTMGHEFQHLINGWRRTYITSSALEEGWLNEGLSHIAEELMFYRTSVGLGPKQNIVVTQLTTGPNASRRVAAYNTYANQNFGRLRGWLQRPDTVGVFDPSHQNSLAMRGAIWSFLRYASDRVNTTDQSFFFGLVNNGMTGQANLQNSIGGADPHNWLRDWTTAMYTDDAVAGISSEYTNPSWSYRSLFIALIGTYQLAPRPLTNGVGLTLSYAREGGTAYARFGVPSGGFAGVTALSGGIPPVSPYVVQVTRTK